MKVKVSTGKEEIMVIIIKKFIMRIYTLKPNLFRLIAHVFHHRVYRQELQLITICLTAL